MPSTFSASKAAMMMSCHASANLDIAIPNWTPPVEDRAADNAANRGTAKHEIVAPIMSMSATEIEQFAKLLSYVAEVRRRRIFKTIVEQRTIVNWLDSKPPTTVDLVLYVQDELHILDSKWGKIPVSAHNNAQLLYYAVTWAHLAPKAKEVHLHIMQPAIDNFEEVVVSSSELHKFMLDAQATDRAITAGSVNFGPSDECKFCPANPHGRGQKGSPLCPTMMNMLYPPVVHEDDILGL